MSRKSVIITGATGFIGTNLMEALRKDYTIFAIGRLSPKKANAPEGPHIHWFQVDVGHFDELHTVFCEIRKKGGADYLIHLAAHYDFTGEDHPEYVRSNVVGTLNVIELAASMLKLKRFFFTSSVAACPFPPPGGAVTEDTPPIAAFPYARSKWLGEEIMKAYKDRVPTCSLRLAAVFSDWCEYLPLYEFIETWCSNRWNSRILGGRGESSIPYIHIDDLVSFYSLLLRKNEHLGPAEVLMVSPNGSTSHKELFREVTLHWFGAPRTPIYTPKALAHPGVKVRSRLGGIVGRKPFERPWMIELVDLKLNADATLTYRRMNWAPSPDLHILKRIPRMMENKRNHPREWKHRNEWREERRRRVLEVSTKIFAQMSRGGLGRCPVVPLV
jgi:nucleoside-diphosphate-sugar epimerase